VFDSEGPVIKKHALEMRKKRIEDTRKKYDDAVDDEEKKKYYLRSEVTEKEYEECEQLISLFGYTVIRAHGEADILLSELSLCGKIDYCVSDDMDLVVFGSKNLLKNFTVSSKKKIQEIDLEQFKKDSKLSLDMIIDVSILIGCDYCTGSFGIGPVKAYNYVLKYGSIDNVIKHEHIELNVNYKKIREYFKSINVKNCDNVKILNMNCDKVILRKFLEKYKFTDDYINKILLFNN
jgi:flap endonuclease-1